MDYLYLILVLPAVIFSLWASIRVNTTFKKYSKIRSMRGITGAEAARRVLDANGLQHIRIEQIPGNPDRECIKPCKSYRSYGRS